MILYTPLDHNDIFTTTQDQYKKQKMMEVEGRPVLVNCLPDGTYQVVQLLSTNPHDYLESPFQPGEIVNN
ncbi:YlzJ-like family protein [Paraliobacillus salinarum]|uniref:YlzJ-like family protein n=1 Tax=Paraliobacillus salinarum TaxID=1158996 RepID=UPI0015F51CCF|nr:YlzJ-like family protein [Paraliobacillus salinarum]